VVRQLIFIGITALMTLTLTGAAHGTSKPEKMTLTLDKALSIAMENNRDILIAREARNRAEQQIREARAGALPQLNFSANYTRTLKKPIFFFNVGGEVVRFSPGFNNSLMQTVSLNQTLYSGGRTGAAVKIASTYASSFDESLRQTEKNVRLQVKQTFLGVLLSREVLNINRRSLENAEKHRENIRALYKNGMAAEFDLLRAEVEVENLRPKVISAENALVLQKNALKNILGIPLDQTIALQGELKAALVDPGVIEENSRNAYADRNDYKNIELLRNAYQHNINIERAGWFPMISANYTYQYEGQSDDWGFSKSYRSQNLGLNFTLPLFDGLRTSARVQQAKINVKEMDYQLVKLREGIEIQIAQARNAMAEARKRIESTEKTVEQAEKAYRIALVRFDTGQGIQIEIFDAQVALELAQLNRMQSIFDYETAKAQWENAIGR